MKKYIRSTLPLVLLFAIAYGGYRMAVVVKQQKEIAEKTISIPAFSLKTLDGKLFTNACLKNKTPVVFLYFNSECEFCEEETKTIAASIRQLDGMQLIFVSFEPLQDIIRFRKKYKLDEYSNVLFLQDYQNSFQETFGMKTLPSFLVYDKNGQLLCKNSGAVKTDYLLNILKVK